MDKYEYRVKTEQMLQYFEEKSYKKAMEIADTIDWRRIKNISMLTTVSDIYENTNEFSKARDILFLIYDKVPNSRKLIYRMGILSIKMKSYDEAMDCYEEYIRLAPKDPSQHILRYKILSAQKAPLGEQISVLEEFKRAEYVERWAYELAKLYHEAGMVTECLEECDDLILWFSEGEYVYRAMELKMKYKPLTPIQQEKYSARIGKMREVERKKPVFKKPTATAKPDPAVAQKIRDNVHVTGSIDLPELPEPMANLDMQLESLPDETPRTTRRKTKIENTSDIVTTITGDTLEDVIKAGVAVAHGEDPNKEEEMPQVTGQMRIEEILAQWEVTQRENQKIIQQNQEKLDKQKEAEEAKVVVEEKKNILSDDIRQLMEDIENGVEFDVTPEPEEEYEEVVELDDEPVENMGQLVESLQLIEDDAVEAEEYIEEEYAEAEDFIEEEYVEAEDFIEEEYAEAEDFVEEEYVEAEDFIEEEPVEEIEEEIIEEEPVEEIEEDFIEEEFVEAKEVEEEFLEEEVELIEEEPIEEEFEEEYVEEYAEAEDFIEEEYAEAEELYEDALDFEEDEYGYEEDFESDLDSELEKLEVEESARSSVISRATKMKFDTGFIVQGRYDLSATSEIGLKAGLTEEQKKLFTYFVPVRGVSEQIVEILDNDRRCRNRKGTSATGNIVVIGKKGTGKTVLAVDIVKAIQKQRRIKQGKVAIVTGESLNNKAITDVVNKLYGGALIIEKAAAMNDRTVRELSNIMATQTGELLIILEEQKKPLEKLFTQHPEFRARFTSKIELPTFINDELVTFGQTYAKENGYTIDEMGILALYSRIDMLQREDHAVTVTEVKEILDEAFEKSRKTDMKRLVKRVFGKRTDENNRVILKEEDFNI